MNHSFEQSQSSSRPFLNLLNPIGRHYPGYTRESLLEEDEREPSESHIPNKHISFGPNAIADDNSEEDDAVPQSLLIETSPQESRPPDRSSSRRSSKPRFPARAPLLPTSNFPPFSIPPRPSELDSRPPQGLSHPPTTHSLPKALNTYERALWKWINVYNLDAFITEVYTYYTGKGIYCIILAQALNLLTVGFVIIFTFFLTNCLDYSRIQSHGATRLSDVVVGKCFSKFSGITLCVFGGFYLFQIVTFVTGIGRLVDMYRFYTHLLGVPDADIQTISWPDIVRRLGAIRNEHPLTAISSTAQEHPDSSSRAKLDAHDVANRIMRQENYLIALFNKDLLDLQLRMPPFLSKILDQKPESNGKGETLTRALEWNLRYCLLGYLFDESGKVKKVFTREKNRRRLIDKLRQRFIFMGILNAILVPFIVVYLLIYSFFRYFEQYRNDPSVIGSRRYTAFAYWKFREFNELPHLFKRRLDTSYPTANMYVNQFPKEKTTLAMRFVAFVAGSFAGVLLLASVIDPDLLSFEITPHRTILFYLGVFGTVLAVARGMVPEENRVFDPELLMQEVIHHTHYMPAEWKGQLHSQMVHEEFGHLFNMKVSIFIQEILSVVLTPFILCFSLPDCAPGIVDFFREFTVHVEDLGYVCSFAVFDFKRHGNINFGAPTEQADERYQSKQGKMEKSFLNFKAAHPEWNPTDPSGSLYLSRLANFHSTVNPPTSRKHVDITKRMPTAERAQLYDQALRKSIARRKPAPQVRMHAGRIPDDDRVADGGIGSNLGDSYIDDVRTQGGQIVLVDDGEHTNSRLDQDEAEELASGGVIGLLAQIYDHRRRGF